MRKAKKRTKKRTVGTIVQIAATGGDKLFALTSHGEVFERVENEDGYAEWEQISELCPENIAETEIEDEG